MIVGERHRILDLIGLAVELRWQAVPVEHRDQPLVERGDAAGVERHLLARLVAGPQHHRVAAQVEGQGEGAAIPGRGRQGRVAARIGLERDVPAMIHPRRMGDANLAEHLRGEVKHGEGLMITLKFELGPVAHALPPITGLCILRRSTARAPDTMIDAETMIDRIAAAPDLKELEALRVAALGKSGSVTALLKSLGSMDAETRAVEGPEDPCAA